MFFCDFLVGSFIKFAIKKALKKSLRQKELINILNAFCGIDELTRFLQKFKRTLPVEDKMNILSLIHYYQSLYLYKVPVESDSIEYRAFIIETLNLLKKSQNAKSCKYLIFLIDLIEGSLERSKNMRFLA